MTLTHFCDWDEPGRLTVRSLCGVYIRRSDHANAPTCEACQAALDYRAALERARALDDAASDEGGQ